MRYSGGHSPQFGADPLLQTKLARPVPRASLVSRQRLDALLHAGMARRLILIAAPAGSGKTTLLSDWFHRHAGAVAWVSLDAADNDPTRFWSYILTALEGVYPGVGATSLPLLQTPELPPIETILTIALNELASRSREAHGVLVLDDYHVITAPPIHRAIAFLLEHLPPRFHLVIATRADPPLPVARWRVRDDVTEIRAADLRFTTDEATGFLTEMIGAPLATDEVAALEMRTEGWIAGLQLAALSLRGRPDGRAFIAAFSGSQRFIADYLIEEVLERQPADVRTFLLETAILDRLCGPLCDAVTGGRGDESNRVFGQGMLERIEAANLFVVPLDDARGWYRYHHLFADVLHNRLRHLYPDRVPDLYRRASDWCAGQGLTSEAIEYAFAGRDWSHAAMLLDVAYRPLINRGQQVTLQRWFEMLPEAVRDAHPWLTVNYAWLLLFNGETDAYARPLARAEAAWRARGDEYGLGEVYRARAHVARLREDATGAIANGRNALALLAADDLPLRGSAAAALGKGLVLSGALDEAAVALAEARGMIGVGDSSITGLLIDDLFGDIAALRGDLHGAATIYRDVLARAGDRPLWQVVDARIGLGDLYREWNDLGAAEEWVGEGIALARQTKREIYAVRGYLTLARIQYTQGRWAEAAETLARAGGIARKLGNTRAVAEAEAWQALLSLASGDRDAVDRWMVAQPETDMAHGAPQTVAGERERLIFARILLARGDAAAAHARLQHLLPVAERQGRTGSVIEILVRTALCHAARHERDDATRTLEQARRLAEPGGYCRVFLDEGPSLAALRSFAPATVATTGPLIEPLSERERDVLQLLAAGLSNGAIAERLFITVGTVKTHVKSLYSKFDVHSRTQAVARARELGLL